MPLQLRTSRVYRVAETRQDDFPSLPWKLVRSDQYEFEREVFAKTGVSRHVFRPRHRKEAAWNSTSHDMGTDKGSASSARMHSGKYPRLRGNAPTYINITKALNDRQCLDLIVLPNRLSIHDSMYIATRSKKLGDLFDSQTTKSRQTYHSPITLQSSLPSLLIRYGTLAPSATKMLSPFSASHGAMPTYPFSVVTNFLPFVHQYFSWFLTHCHDSARL